MIRRMIKVGALDATIAQLHVVSAAAAAAEVVAAAKGFTSVAATARRGLSGVKLFRARVACRVMSLLSRDKEQGLASLNDRDLGQLCIALAKLLSPGAGTGPTLALDVATLLSRLATAHEPRSRSFVNSGIAMSRAVQDLADMPRNTPWRAIYDVVVQTVGKERANKLRIAEDDYIASSVGSAVAASSGGAAAAAAAATGGGVNRGDVDYTPHAPSVKKDTAKTTAGARLLGAYVGKTVKRGLNVAWSSGNTARKAVAASVDEIKNLVATISVGELSHVQRQHLRRVSWTVVLSQYTAYFLVAVVWVFGGWAVVTYGVLIRTYLGPGEERTYMSVWAMTFLVNTFGVEALQQVGRKALFMYMLQRANGFMKTRAALDWYELFAEQAGAAALAQASGEEYSFESREGQQGQDEEGDDVDFDGGD